MAYVCITYDMPVVYISMVCDVYAALMPVVYISMVCDMYAALMPVVYVWYVMCMQH